MSGWDSHRTVHGAELRAAAREFSDHGWPVVEQSPSTLLVVTGRTLDALEVPAAVGHGICAQLRAADVVVAVAATPTGSWWYPVSAGAELPAVLRGVPGLVLHGAGDAVVAPPSEVPSGWVHWRVAPALCGYRVPAADLIFSVAEIALRADHDVHPRGRWPACAVPVGMRS